MSSHFIKPIADTLNPELYRPLRVTPLMPNFGAYIDEVDLTAKLSIDVRAKLREAFYLYGVVIFRQQPKLSLGQQLEVASIFGTPDSGSPYVEKASSQVDVITTDENRPPVTNLWHSDNTTLASPSLGTMIQIQKCPPVGGNTSWACTRKAYDCLSNNWKACLEGLTAIHFTDCHGHREPTYLDKPFDDAYFAGLKKHPPREQPVVMEHPVTKQKSIYINETYTQFIRNVSRHESDAIMNFLFLWIRMPEFYLTHLWHQNDVAIWDNFTVQHYGNADYSSHRVNQRVTFAV